MPISSRDLEEEPFLRLLMLGVPKLGKTAAAIATAPGPVYVLLCEATSALKGAKRLNDKPFDYDMITSWESMERGIKEAREGAKAGKYKTIVVDPFSNFAHHIEKILRESTDNDARRWSPEYNNRLDHIIEQLFRIPAHVIVISHYIDTGGGVDGEEKVGEGRLPLLAGKARQLIAAKFNDVIWMDFMNKPPKDGGEAPWLDEPYNGRVFVTGPQGAWGPGCRSLHGTRILPADIGLLLKAFAEDAAPKKMNGAAKSSGKVPDNKGKQQQAKR
jgi:hypothetical protein